MRATLLFLLIAMRSVSAVAGQADCHDYTEAKGENRSLFAGFIYGYVSSVLQGRSPAEIKEVTLRVKRETDKYCLLQPAGSPHSAIALFASVERRYRQRK